MDLEAEAIAKQILIFRCDEIIDNADNREKINKLENQLLEHKKAVDYRKYEIDADRSFEASCLVIGKEFGKDAKKMTVFEYESASKMLRDREKEMKKHRK